MEPPNCLSGTVPERGYTVYRDIGPGGEYDITAPIHFYPPSCSDELFNILRVTYPLIYTHSGRLRQAVTDFIKEENEQVFAPVETVLTSASCGTSPALGSPSNGTASAARSMHGTESSELEQRQDQNSLESAILPDWNMPSQDEMIGVFSLRSSAHRKTHARRRMTEQERAEYRERRLLKACETCARRKRKCFHKHEQPTSPRSQVHNRASDRAASSANSTLTEFDTTSSGSRQTLPRAWTPDGYDDAVMFEQPPDREFPETKPFEEQIVNDPPGNTIEPSLLTLSPNGLIEQSRRPSILLDRIALMMPEPILGEDTWPERSLAFFLLTLFADCPWRCVYPIWRAVAKLSQQQQQSSPAGDFSTCSGYILT